MREPNWDAMLMHGNPRKLEPEIEQIIKDIHGLYDEAKKEYDEWDRIAKLAHADGDTSTEGVLINRAKAEVIIGTVHTCADDYLIAAAPDLLEAAKAVVNKVMRAGEASTCLDDTGIHEAIAKAIGAD